VKTTIVPGAALDVLTPDEARELLRQEYRQTVEQHVRAEGTGKMDGTGTGTIDIYTCPVGFEFEARRILIESDQLYHWVKTVPALGQGAPGQAVIPLEYLRSGESLGRPFQDMVIKTAVPTDEVWYLFPHLDTWSAQQGPYLRNGETLQLACRGCVSFASINVQVTVEGIQRRPPPTFH
jgi:hypothetical protein